MQSIYSPWNRGSFSLRAAQVEHRGGRTRASVWGGIPTTSSPNPAGRADAGVEAVGARRSGAPRPVAGTCRGPRARRPARTRHRHQHSPIFPLGFVDVTVSASANFAALVFKQVLDPLPLAAQLHFKVIVHCHSLRGRGAGVGGAGGHGRGPGKHRQPQPPGALPLYTRRPQCRPDCCGKSWRRPRESAGDIQGGGGTVAGGGWGGTGRLPRTQEGERRERAGGGERVSRPCPRWLPAPAPRLSPALPGRAFCSRCGEPPSGRCGLSCSQTRTHASPSRTRTLALTHSLTFPSTPTERQRRTTAGASSERGGGRGLSEHGRGCRKNVAKARAASDPPSIPLRRGCLPPPALAPEHQAEGTR